METKQRQRKPWRQPSEVCTGLEGEMAQFEELSVAILEKAEGGREYSNKAAFLEDLKRIVWFGRQKK